MSKASNKQPASSRSLRAPSTTSNGQPLMSNRSNHSVTFAGAVRAKKTPTTSRRSNPLADVSTTRSMPRLDLTSELLDDEDESTTDEKMVFKSAHEVYREVEMLGKGGFGSVYKVVAKSDADKVLRALKAIHNPTKNKAFETDANLLKNVTSSPYVIKYLDAFFFNPFTCIVTEYCEADLKMILDDLRKNKLLLDDSRIIKWSLECLKGLNELHLNGVIHRNLKPSNLFINNNTLKVGDIGVTVTMSSLRRSSSSLGTLEYLPPEVINMIMDEDTLMENEETDILKERFTIKSDLWSFGCVFYEMITGKKLFRGLPLKIIQSVSEFDQADLDPIDNHLYERVIDGLAKQTLNLILQ